MTNDQISAMQSGRELDALVAKHIFPNSKDIFTPVWSDKECPYQWDADGNEITWKPSTDISAAWEVVKKINESGWMLYKLANTLSGLGVIDGYICILLHLESGASREDVSETVSEAICKSALLAVMEVLPKAIGTTALPSEAAAETGLGGEQNNES